jgi:DNA polymerase-3 subunit delta
MGKKRGREAAKNTTDADLKKLRARFKKGDIPRTIVIYGEDDFRRSEVARRLPQWVVGGDLELASVVLDGREASPSDILGQLESNALPFMDVERRAVLVRETPLLSEKSPKGSKGLVERIEQGLPEHVTLILEASTDSPKGTVYKACKTEGVELAFPKSTKPADATQFVRDRFRYAGIQIDSDALGALVGLAPPDTGLLNSEVRKLISFVGDRGRVTEEDVRRLVSRTKEAITFDLTDALGERDVEQAMATLQDLIHQGHSGVAIVALLASRLRLLLVACALIENGSIPDSLLRVNRYGDTFRTGWRAAAKELKPLMPEERACNLAAQHDFVAFKTLKEARRFTTSEMARGLQLAAEADLALKSTTSASESDILENLVLSLCHPDVRIHVAAAQSGP